MSNIFNPNIQEYEPQSIFILNLLNRVYFIQVNHLLSEKEIAILFL